MHLHWTVAFMFFLFCHCKCYKYKIYMWQLASIYGLSLSYLLVGGQVWYSGWEVPGCFFRILAKRSIPKPDQHRKDIQQETLGTDML